MAVSMRQNWFLRNSCRGGDLRMRRRIFGRKEEGLPALPRREWRESTGYIPNPGQGWYHIYTYDAGLPFDSTDETVAEGEVLALVRINLERYREGPLTEDCLENIRSILFFFDKRRIDIILRIAYDFEGQGLEKEPDLFSQVEDHLKKLAPIVRAFENRIVAFQGLLVGSWGEMHQSKFLSAQRIRALERAFRSGGNGKVWLALRRPAFLRALMGGEENPVERRTLFDDAIGGSDSDMGTFGWKRQGEALWEEPWVRVDELEFIDTFCAGAPVGGETVLPIGGEEIPPDKIIYTLKRMHLSYLNCQHDKRQLALWQGQRLQRRDVWNGISLYDYIGAHMGYRFCVRRASVKTRRSRQVLSVEIENTGFGGLLQEAEAELVCIDSAGVRHIQALDWDARLWQSGSRTSCTAQIEMPPGKLYLGLRRKWDGYPICFANEETGLSTGEEMKDGYVSLC